MIGFVGNSSSRGGIVHRRLGDGCHDLALKGRASRAPHCQPSSLLLGRVRVLQAPEQLKFVVLSFVCLLSEEASLLCAYLEYSDDETHLGFAIFPRVDKES